MYGGYAWLTNAVPPRTTGLRLLLLAGMAGFFVLALTIPTAFGQGGLAFGLAYLLVTALHTAMFLFASRESILRSMARLGPFNAVTAAPILAAAFAGGWVRLAPWAGAFVLHWITPFLTQLGGFTVRPAHFVERHGLILLIALGESVVAVGVGARAEAGAGQLVAMAGIGLLIAAGCWWLYFDGDDEAAERVLEEAPENRRPWLAITAFGYAFLPILGGIVLLAAGIKLAIPSGAGAAPSSASWLLAAGAATYAAGLALFRASLGIRPLAPRIVVALLALATAPIGAAISLAAQLVALAAVVLGCNASTGLSRRLRAWYRSARYARHSAD
jgi:low temperature requirement protein LtrA